MSIDFTTENGGQLLTMRISGQLDADVLNQVYDIVKSHLTSGMRQVLVLRQGAEADYDFDTGLAFGKRAGDLLAKTGVVIAVVKSEEQGEDVSIDTIIFNSGVSLGQFNSEAEARDWLALKAE